MRRDRTPTGRSFAALGRLLGALTLAGVLTASTLALLPACAAPTLPLPPPSALVETPDASGMVTITGDARPNALVLVFNETREEGVIVVAAPDGRFTVRIAASVGEILTIWQMVGGDSSELLTREVPNR